MTKKATKTWCEKLAAPMESKVNLIEKDFAGIAAGSRMFIATPALIETYIRHIPPGRKISLSTLRNDLALAHNSDATCPVTTGIFLRIVAEANYERYKNGTPIDQLTPFWRVIDTKSQLAGKLSFGSDFIREMTEAEAT